MTQLQQKRFIPDWLQRMSGNMTLSLLVSLYIVLKFNHHILTFVMNTNGVGSISQTLFIVSVFITLLAMIWVVTELPNIGRGGRWWIMTVIIIAAITGHAQETYHIMFDKIMFRNIVETDPAEASELISAGWFFDVAVYGILPALIISRIPIRREKFLPTIGRKVAFLTTIIALLLANIFPFYDRYASLLRTQRQIKDMIIPTGFLYSGWKYASTNLLVYHHDFISIGEDATHTALPDGHKRVVVMIVGETARAANFSMAGYKKNTNPLLSRRLQEKNDMVFYPQFYACGTSTAVSVPCMLSIETEHNFDVDDAAYQENLLDVFARAGFDVTWLDNNSGCKGTCKRVTFVDMNERLNDPHCTPFECADMVLVDALKEILPGIQKDTLIILHQKGSHGPAYFERVPKKYQVFQPVCQSNQLQECTETEVINSYDNTILYTDAVIDAIINTLDASSMDIIPSVLYASDHGESLGEHNLYLHGIPRAIAPDVQIHIPALLWLPERSARAYGVDMQCLRDAAGNHYSHDNIFHTLLDIAGIRTHIYNKSLDILQGCKNKEDATIATMKAST